MVGVGRVYVVDSLVNGVPDQFGGLFHVDIGGYTTGPQRKPHASKAEYRNHLASFPEFSVKHN